ncbi:unnamed protein product [Tilletia caries]|uniref:DUF659 domain-containing protein n=1 Tax=Tilletia caries TaxID=13290 RepID=A0ABN7J1G3_9BASI|nr:unnamed protein product [Tilletia caries]
MPATQESAASSLSPSTAAPVSTSTATTSNPPTNPEVGQVSGVPSHKKLPARPPQVEAVSSSSSRPKARLLKPGQPDRNLDPFLPRTVRVERVEASSDSEAEAALSPEQLRASIKKAAKIGKGKSKQKAGTAAAKRTTSKKADLASESEFDDLTDDEAATPPSAQNPKEKSTVPPKSVSVSIDLTGDSQEQLSDKTISPTKGTASPTKASNTSNKSSIKGKAKEEPKRTRRDPSPEKALEAAKKSWRLALEAVEQDAIAESKSGGKAQQTGPMDAFMVKKNPHGAPVLHITAAEARQIAVEWVTSSSRPLSIVEDSGFSRLLSPEVRAIMPGRKVVGDDVVRIYNGMQDVIRGRLAAVTGCFHLALDVWTSKNGNSFLGITVNYQEKGEAKRHLLDMLPFLAAHDSKNMSKAVYQAIQRVGINDRIWNIVTDNASENSAMLPLLSGMGGMPRFRGKASQVRCMAHVCNLVSQAVANTFIKAATSVEVKKKQAPIEDSTEEEEAEGGAGAGLAESEYASGSDEEEGSEREEGAESDDEEGSDDVLDEPDEAISTAVCADLAANQDDEAELRQIHSGPRTHPRSLNTPNTPASGPLELSSSECSTPQITTTAAEEEEQELRNGEVGLQIKKLAWLSKKIHYSPSARRKWKRECRKFAVKKPWTLLRDVATRWDSTQRMIARGVDLWKAVISFTENNLGIVDEKHRLRRTDKATSKTFSPSSLPWQRLRRSSSFKVRPMIGEVVERIQMFQAIIGCLNWLVQASRPDIAYAVATLARHCKNPGPIHFGVVKRVMRYLVATADYKFRIAAHSINDVTAYSDADFGGDFSAKSTSGYSVSVHGATVAWGAKLQSLIADSTAQAELIAVWQTAREVLALRHFLEDLGLRTPDSGPASIIYCDNQPALHIITNPVANGLTRHMERKYLLDICIIHDTWVETGLTF